MDHDPLARCPYCDSSIVLLTFHDRFRHFSPDVTCQICTLRIELARHDDHKRQTLAEQIRDLARIWNELPRRTF